MGGTSIYPSTYSVFLPPVDVRPGDHHVVVDLDDLVRVVISVKCQQLASQCVGFIHLTLPLLQLPCKELRKKGTGAKRDTYQLEELSTCV